MTIMPYQKPRASGATPWREVRVRAITEGRLSEEAMEVQKRRLLAANIGHALAKRRQATRLTQAELAVCLGMPARHVARLESGHPDEVRFAALRAYLRALRGKQSP